MMMVWWSFMPPSSSFSLITIHCEKVTTSLFWTIFLCCTAHWIKPERFCSKNKVLFLQLFVYLFVRLAGWSSLMPPSSSFSLITIQCVKVMTLVFWTIFLCSTAHWIKPEMFCTKKTNDKWYNIGKWKQCTTINFTLWKQHKSGRANHKYVAKSRSIFHDFLFLHIHSHCPRLFLVTNIKVLQLLLLKIEVLSVAS